jgi:hypothetical protein
VCSRSLALNWFDSGIPELLNAFAHLRSGYIARLRDEQRLHQGRSLYGFVRSGGALSTQLTTFAAEPPADGSVAESSEPSAKPHLVVGEEYRS